MRQQKVAVVGAGVSGCSTALALLEAYPNLDLTIFSDRPFEKTTSFGPAGVFRVTSIHYKDYARETFKRFEQLYKTHGSKCGLQLVSGFLMSDNFKFLKDQETFMAEYVYGFRWLKQRDMGAFAVPYEYGIHYSAFTSEGRKYVPWLMGELKSRGAKFQTRAIGSLDWLGNDFDFVINCAGLGARLLADDKNLVPIRGVLFEIVAPQLKHFTFFGGDDIFILPSTESTFVGTTRQKGRYDLEVTDEDRKQIWDGILRHIPALKGVKVKDEWVGLRPHRDNVRVEVEQRTANAGNAYKVIHNYGHSGNGFVLSWGCAKKVAELFGENLQFSSHL